MRIICEDPTAGGRATGRSSPASAAGSNTGEKAMASFLRGRLLNLGPQYCSEAEDLLSRAVRLHRDYRMPSVQRHDGWCRLSSMRC